MTDPTETNPRPAGSKASAAPQSIDDINATALQIVRELVAELHPKLIDARLVRLDSDLDRDLALEVFRVWNCSCA